MSPEQVTTTGTPNEDGGDALEQTGTAGTPQEDGRDAEPKGKVLTEDQWKAALEWKSKAEKAEEYERRLREVESARPQSPAAVPDDFERQREALVRRIAAAAEAGDPSAQYQLLQIEREEQERFEKEQERREIAAELALSRLPADEAEAVRAHVKANPGAFNSIKQARNDLRAQKMEQENARLRQQVEQLSKKPDPEVMNAPPTHGRETTARGTNIYDQARWHNDMNALNARIEAGDKKAHEEKIRLQIQRRNGTLPWRED